MESAMRITGESDYALRICYILALNNRKTNASVISEATGVSLRFALKILRKLCLAGLVRSYKGAAGGYALMRCPDEISVGDIIEVIDGPFRINNCLAEGYVCTRMGEALEECCFHNYFEKINSDLSKELKSAYLSAFLPDATPSRSGQPV